MRPPLFSTSSDDEIREDPRHRPGDPRAVDALLLAGIGCGEVLAQLIAGARDFTGQHAITAQKR